ncbi:DUF1552 domain-containing protein [Persicimonas caeni]|uniref:DUF1552 domain-containing protein n=1 Tax=Persicimonas caeni TaxID=2292766 RepID=A0A4Y6PZH7_PERCE|nr:DUF1552 domain-containing protein [Persicimonas caeni]QDG53155.1 DUF1552 domain-containing protein [Persicimonas caeni]QED34377.1 DUF1552 domain-containing protein [Persicimonas caeni]
MDRRSFLKTLGLGVAGAATLPLMPSLSMSAGEQFPTRMVIFFSANGTIPWRWKPSGGETDWSIPDDGILAPLRGYEDDLLILDGIDMISARYGPGDGHQRGMGHMLTGTELGTGDFTGGNGELAGYAGGISVDQYIAGEIHNGEMFDSLELGVQCGGPTTWSRMCSKGNNQPVEPVQNPYTIYERVFGAIDQSEAERARHRARRGSVLDFVREDLRQVKQKASSVDRQRLEQHLTAIRELEGQLNTGDDRGFACEAPDQGSVIDPSKEANFPQVGKLMMDMLVASLACGLTRVASLQWSRSVSQIAHAWAGVSGRHHDLSHEGDSNTDAVESLVKINRWYAEQFAYLIDKMKQIPEGDGTLLDNTLVVWANELGKGNSHTRNNVPYVIAGSGGGQWQTGRYLTFDDDPHNNFLVSLCRAMGVQADTFGNPQYCTGALPGLA